ncbi:MAG: terminase small subunit [Alkaliphilus sp.]
MRELTLKQRAFADYYIELGNATEAARRAGYSKKTLAIIGFENLRKLKIKTYIDKRLEKIEFARIASAAEVLQYLTKAVRMELDEEVVVIEGTGDGCSEARVVRKQISTREAIKAAELLGKRYRMFTDKVAIEGAIPVVIKDDLAEDEEKEDHIT